MDALINVSIYLVFAIKRLLNFKGVYFSHTYTHIIALVPREKQKDSL